jgi:protein TonB
MRVHLAIIFSLACGPALADESVSVTSTKTNQTTVQIVSPVSIGRPHVCTNDYPEAAQEAGAEGTVTLTFTITTAGTVKDIKIAKSSDSKSLDDASVLCVSHWLYKPATKGGAPEETPWTANVVWKIPEMTPEEFRATMCAAFRTDNSPIPANAGTTSVTYRVMPDGEMTGAVVARSSGDISLDNAALECVKAGRYDTSTITLPPDGVPGHSDIAWAHAIQPPPSAPAK